MSEQNTVAQRAMDRPTISVERMRALMAGHLGIILGVPRRYPAMASSVAALHRIYGIPLETLGQLYRELVNHRSGPPWQAVAEEIPAVLAEWDAKKDRSARQSPRNELD